MILRYTPKQKDTSQFLKSNSGVILIQMEELLMKHNSGELFSKVYMAFAVHFCMYVS